jgi:hypothetical protein
MSLSYTLKLAMLPGLRVYGRLDPGERAGRRRGRALHSRELTDLVRDRRLAMLPDAARNLRTGRRDDHPR